MADWRADRNTANRPIDWRFTTADARTKLDASTQQFTHDAPLGAHETRENPCAPGSVFGVAARVGLAP
ncbi:MAG: hypothetical protein AVDCRST_MAG73-3062 [uncultured Thermomicrobiales bacterium]|uniref:Uncharacterized protein n=1 Tax=uncultured Thermomicrobiales bacterium TaxID=1645740 RepID=A0A6J4ULI3_9BACT|nr:MAG: hypothetical protein AVDCRST_MAG73-3062 [uncultured Thermomicrobiales bacterium]